MKAATLHWYRTASDASPLGFELRAEHRGRTWRMYRLADTTWRVRPTDRPQKEATFRTPEEARRWAAQQAVMNPRIQRYARNPQRRSDRKATFRKGQKVALRRPIQPAAAGSVFTVAAVDTKRWKTPRYRLPVGWVAQKDLMPAPKKNPLDRDRGLAAEYIQRRGKNMTNNPPRKHQAPKARSKTQFRAVYVWKGDVTRTDEWRDSRQEAVRDAQHQIQPHESGDWKIESSTGEIVDLSESQYQQGVAIYDRHIRSRGVWGNPRGATEVDEVAARELELYIDNDEPLYRQWQAIVRNMWKHTKRGRYDSKRAADGFMHLVDAGAKKYAKEFGSSDAKWFEIFDMPTRRYVATEYAKSFENNSRDENYYKPEGMRANPESDVFRDFATPAGTEVLWIGAAESYVLVSDEGALLSREILLAAATPDELDAMLREYNPRKKNPAKRKRNGAGLGALIGSTIGAVFGFGVSSVPLAALGSLVGGTVGGYIGAPKDRKKRGAAGGAIGGAVLGPIGAGIGGYIGGRKPDKDYGRRNNPAKNPYPDDVLETPGLVEENAGVFTFRGYRFWIHPYTDGGYGAVVKDPDTGHEEYLSAKTRNYVIAEAIHYIKSKSTSENPASTSSLERYSKRELERMPSISSGHTDELKVEENVRGVPTRWWLSRMTVEDGETNAVHVEQLVSGRWQVVHDYEEPDSYDEKYGENPSSTYTVHGHFVRPDGSKDTFWTRTGLSKSAAQKLVREQRRDGGVAEIVPDVPDRNPASCGCSHDRSSSMSRRIANP